MTGRFAADLFADEPRDEPWATEVERLLAANLTSDLQEAFPDVHRDRFECRTSSCQIEVSVASAQRTGLFLYLQHLGLGGVIEPQVLGDEAGVAKVQVTLLFSPGQREPLALENSRRERRSADIEFAKSQGRPVPPQISPQ